MLGNAILTMVASMNAIAIQTEVIARTTDGRGVRGRVGAVTTPDGTRLVLVRAGADSPILS